jgi:hypothetical protein
MDGLALQVGQFHYIRIDDPERADPRSRQILDRRAPEPPRPDDKHARLAKRALA